MKKTVALVLLLTTVTVFFCSSVFAATDDASIQESYNAEFSGSGIVVRLSATQMFSERDYITLSNSGTASSSSTGHISQPIKVLVMMSVFNWTDNYKIVDNIHPKLTFNTIGSTYAVVSDVVNFGDDIKLIYYDDNDSIDTIANVDWAVGLTGFRVPPNTTINALACFTVNSNLSAGGVNSPTLSGISFVGDPTATDTGVYPLGSHQDITDEVRKCYLYLSSSEYGLPVIIDALQNIDVDATTIINVLNAIHTDTSRINQNVLDIKGILQGNTSSNTGITDDSNSLKTTSDNVHTQEQAYFTQNSQAIQATGLGNYQIGTVEGNGIGAVSNDFTSIWNALSGWNAVYIFSLTLGLALTILRHAPNAISRRQRRKQE